MSIHHADRDVCGGLNVYFYPGLYFSVGKYKIVSASITCNPRSSRLGLSVIEVVVVAATPDIILNFLPIRLVDLSLFSNFRICRIPAAALKRRIKGKHGGPRFDLKLNIFFSDTKNLPINN